MRAPCVGVPRGGGGLWSRKCYYLPMGLLRIFKIRDLFYEKRNPFQEKPVFSIVYEILKHVFS